MLMVFHWSLKVESCWVLWHINICRLSIYLSIYLSIIIIIIIIHSLELFTSALADGFSLESEWQQVSSSLQDTS